MYIKAALGRLFCLPAVTELWCLADGVHVERAALRTCQKQIFLSTKTNYLYTTNEIYSLFFLVFVVSGIRRYHPRLAGSLRKNLITAPAFSLPDTKTLLLLPVKLYCCSFKKNVDA